MTTKQHPHFDELIGSHSEAIGRAQSWSDAQNEPVGVWQRGGWFAISTIAPDGFQPNYRDPEQDGWALYTFIAPIVKE
jgi:hypothetical protein